MATVQQEQKFFEEMMNRYYPNFSLNKSIEGEYKSAGTKGMWDGWMLKDSHVLIEKYKYLKGK